MGALIHIHEGIADRQSIKVRGIDSRHGKHGETNGVNKRLHHDPTTSPLTQIVRD